MTHSRMWHACSVLRCDAVCCSALVLTPLPCVVTCHTCKWVMFWYGSTKHVLAATASPVPTHPCCSVSHDICHGYVGHDVCACVTCVAWRVRTISMCNVTHSHVWHVSFTCVAWRMRMCACTLALVSLWLISMRNVTHSHVWHVSFTRVAWRMRMCDIDHAHMRVRHATHVNESCHTCEWVMLHMEISHSDTSANAPVS